MHSLAIIAAAELGSIFYGTDHRKDLFPSWAVKWKENLRWIKTVLPVEPNGFTAAIRKVWEGPIGEPWDRKTTSRAERGSSGGNVRDMRRMPPAQSSGRNAKLLMGVTYMGKGLLLWLLGIPIPIIILLFIFHVI
jgi:hypothetical protein